MSKDISETAFASQVEDLLRLYQWRWCHFRPAWTQKGWRTPLTGAKGLPDYIAVRPPRLIFAELKDQRSKLTPEQEGWLEDLMECVKIITLEPVVIRGEPLRGNFPLLTLPEVYLWRPNQIDEINKLLR